MHELSRRAYGRLSFLAAVALVLAVFACRPAWSPDGRKLLFPTVVANKRLGVGLYDRAKGTAELLPVTLEDKQSVNLAWADEGRTAVVLAVGGSGKGSMKVHLLPLEGPGQGRTWALPGRGEHMREGYFVPTVVVGGHLFVADEGILRIDLADGATKQRAPEEGRRLVVSRRGKGLCYVAMSTRSEDVAWELGTVDPETLELTPLFSAPDDRWEPYPSPEFSSDLKRTAMWARSAEGRARAILLFSEGELESVVPLGDATEVDVNNLAWSSDGTRLFVSLCRRAARGDPYRCVLMEVIATGAVSRETIVIAAAGSDEQRRSAQIPSLLFPLALSPDGKIAAFSTAALEGIDIEERGLYLVDLTDEERKVSHVPAPGLVEREGR